MLLEETGAGLLQTGPGIVERSDDPLALRDVEGEHLHIPSVGALELLCECLVVDQAGELQDQVVGTGMPARNISRPSVHVFASDGLRDVASSISI